MRRFSRNLLVFAMTWCEIAMEKLESLDRPLLDQAMSDGDPQYERALHEELERRVDEISRYEASVFGEIGAGELTLAAFVCLVLPLALFWGFR